MMFLQTYYRVIATTDLDIVSNLICNKSVDLVIIDAEPDTQLIDKCGQFKKCRSDIPIILTYVYTNKSKESEGRIKQIVDEIFYKPFDLNEITSKIPELLSH
jgi:DNA-binding response OmpR family regulator